MAPLTIVDMPGYGFAEAPKPKVMAWTRLIHAYLTGRPNLRRVYVLVDGRHGPKANDLSLMNELDKAAVSYQVVLTKADKPSVIGARESGCRDPEGHRPPPRRPSRPDRHLRRKGRRHRRAEGRDRGLPV